MSINYKRFVIDSYSFNDKLLVTYIREHTQTLTKPNSNRRRHHQSLTSNKKTQNKTTSRYIDHQTNQSFICYELTYTFLLFSIRKQTSSARDQTTWWTNQHAFWNGSKSSSIFWRTFLHRTRTWRARASPSWDQRLTKSWRTSRSTLLFVSSMTPKRITYVDTITIHNNHALFAFFLTSKRISLTGNSQAKTFKSRFSKSYLLATFWTAAWKNWNWYGRALLLSFFVI